MRNSASEFRLPESTKEILNSDAKQFGGSGMVKNPRVKMSKKEVGREKTRS